MSIIIICVYKKSKYFLTIFSQNKKVFINQRLNKNISLTKLLIYKDFLKRLNNL